MLNLRAHLAELTKVELALSGLIITAIVVYGVAFLDPYVSLAIIPFFALGSARGKHPLVLLALASIPALILFIISAVKFEITGMPLVTFDHYFLRENVLLLAANDWRIASGVVLGLLIIVFYFKALFKGRGAFTQFERVALAVFSLAGIVTVTSAQSFDQAVVKWDKEINTPSIRAFVMSARIPKPELETTSNPDDILPLSGAKLKAPVGGRPDLVFVLEESTFHPKILSPGYEPKALYASSNPFTSPLRVHTYAGGTWRSEFSLITQMRPQEFGSDGLYVFHQLESRIKRSMFTILKELGYRTMVIYPVPQTFINGHNFYTSIGVDEVYDPESLGIGKGWDWEIPDARFFQAIEKKIAESDKPVVIFMLTINQHGPHNFQEPMTDYIKRFEQSDAAYGAFLENLKKSSRKTGVVAFGDHQPEFTARFIDDHAAWYYTAYDMRCVNFECARTPLTDRGGKPLDIVLLGGMALEAFGFTLDDLSVLQASVFKDCEDDITKCGEKARLQYNTAFSRYFE